MNKEKRRVPKLRFPGFTEDWEQRKLGDYLSIPEKEILEVKSANDLLTVKLNLGGVELGASRDTLSLGSTVYYKRYAGQFIYGKQNFFNGSMGIIPQKLDGKGSSGDVPSFNISNIEANYLYAYVSRESYWRPKVAAASGTGSKRIHEKTLLDFNIDIPSINEQKLISNTFDLINRFITLHQRKLEHLNLKKKALLQKLFPKNGERHPELRFPGFTDAWEQRKLGEVVKSYSGGTPTASNKEYYGGDIPFIRSAEINSDTTELYITQKGLDNSSAKIVEKGTILYAMYGATSGEVGISKINGAINQAILAMIPLEYNSKIIAQYLRKNKESIIGKYLQGGQGNLSANIILELLIQLPGLEESNQIANFLESFDNLITLHQRKLEHLQLQKKALLQQMFV